VRLTEVESLEVDWFSQIISDHHFWKVFMRTSLEVSPFHNLPFLPKALSGLRSLSTCMAAEADKCGDLNNPKRQAAGAQHPGLTDMS
jgi:hypothetical protein